MERECWKVIGKNGHLILSNMRPVLLRHSLNHRLPDGKIEEKTLWNRGFQAELFQAIDNLVQSGAINQGFPEYKKLSNIKFFCPAMQ